MRKLRRILFWTLLAVILGPPVLAQEPDAVPLNQGQPAPFGCICTTDQAYASCIECKITRNALEKKEQAYLDQIDALKDEVWALVDEKDSLESELDVVRDAKAKMELLYQEQVAELGSRTFFEKHGLLVGIVSGVVVTVGVGLGAALAF